MSVIVMSSLNILHLKVQKAHVFLFFCLFKEKIIVKYAPRQTIDNIKLALRLCGANNLRALSGRPRGTGGVCVLRQDGDADPQRDGVHEVLDRRRTVWERGAGRTDYLLVGIIPRGVEFWRKTSCFHFQKKIDLFFCKKILDHLPL